MSFNVTNKLKWNYTSCDGDVDCKLTVESFASTLGFNDTPSTLQLSCVLDPDDQDVYDPNVLNFSSNGTAKGGFSIINAGSYSFGGIIQSIHRTKSTAGNRYEVSLTDPRLFFSVIPVITHLDSFGSSQLNNIIDAIGYYQGNIINADWTEDGMSWQKLLLAITNFQANFYGVRYTFTFDSNFLSSVHSNYRPNLQNPTLAELLSTVASDNNLDYYIVASPATLSNNTGYCNIQVNIRGIHRRQSNIITDDEVNDFLNDREDRVIDYKVGRELRLDPNTVVVFGDFIRTLFIQNSDYSFPIFNILADGTPIDRIFIDLSGIESENQLLLDNLPEVELEIQDLHVLSMSGGNSQGVPKPIYGKGRTKIRRKGYIATLPIIRAALKNIESWMTAVYYSYANNTGFSFEDFGQFAPDYDKRVFYLSVDKHTVDSNDLLDNVPLGGRLIPVEVREMDAFTPARLGIKKPFLNRMLLMAGAEAVTKEFFLNNLETMAVAFACYEATRKQAEEFYGRTFICPITESDYIVSNYQTGERRYDIEYSVDDAGWYENYNGLPGINEGDSSKFPPYCIKNSENPNFQNEDGTIKQMVRIDSNLFVNSTGVFGQDPNGSIPNFVGRGVLADMSEDNIMLISQQNSIANGTGCWQRPPLYSQSGYYLYYSDVSISQYQYDPRFAIVKMNGGLNLNFGNVVAINPEFIFQHRNKDNDLTPFNNDTPIYGWCGIAYNPICYPDNLIKNLPKRPAQNGWQEFLTWLYSDAAVVAYNLFYIDFLNDQRVPAPKVFIKGSQAWVTQSHNQAAFWGIPDGTLIIHDLHLYELLTDPSSIEYGLAEQRYIGGIEPIIPLKWRFQRYGPFREYYSVAGGATIYIDDNLSPWNYGNAARMTTVGQGLSAYSNSEQIVQSNFNATVEGLPDMSLGHALGINSNLAGINLNYGIGGVTTQYTFKSYFGPTALQKKKDFDDLQIVRRKLSKVQKDVFKLEEKVKDFKIEAGELRRG